MKNLLVFTFFLYVVSCATPDGTSELDKINQANVDVIYGYVDAVVDGDLDAVAAVLADNYIGYGPNFGDSVTKEQTIANWQDGWDTLYTSISYERLGTATENADEGPNKGDWVMDWGEVSVDYQDGTSAQFIFNGVFRLENEKIVMSASIYNVADILTQRGFQIVPPASEEESMDE